MMYEVRLTPIDTRPHVWRKVRGYMGDSRAQARKAGKAGRQ
jgi:hypothetical protein